jgi:hypothetical protein
MQFQFIDPLNMPRPDVWISADTEEFLGILARLVIFGKVNFDETSSSPWNGVVTEAKIV